MNKPTFGDSTHSSSRGHTRAAWAPVSADHPEFPSLSAQLPAVNWQEREIQDWFGLKAVGHPHPRRVALHDNWPDVHPLRKDFPLERNRPHRRVVCQLSVRNILDSFRRCKTRRRLGAHQAAFAPPPKVSILAALGTTIRTSTRRFAPNFRLPACPRRSLRGILDEFCLKFHSVTSRASGLELPVRE